MNKRHDAQIANWRRHAATAAIAVAAMIVLAGSWARLNSRSAKERLAVSATHADSPNRCVEGDSPIFADTKIGTVPTSPRMPARAQVAASVSQVAAPLPTVEYCPLQPSATIPTVVSEPAAASGAPTEGRQPPASFAPAAMQPPPAATAAASVVRPSAAPPQPVRTEAMEMIARQADEKIREGMELADRGAAFAARANFIAALRLLAQGLDNDESSTRHSQALRAGLTAMSEAQDFLPAPGKVEGELELPPIIAGHRTPLLKNVPPEQLQAMRAMKQYFTFAQEQLALAAGREISGSMALGALGKLHAALAEKNSAEVALPEAKAITLYQAAMLACPRNYMAANDLGVLLAHKNDYAAARKALEHSVAVCRCAENLKNLSVVYRQLGEPRLAEMAAREAEFARAAELARQRSGNRLAGGTVQWVDASAFAKPSGQWSDAPPRPAATAAAPQAPANPAAPGQPAGPPAAPLIR